MYCKHCGKQIDDNSYFCIYCGQSVENQSVKKEAEVCERPTDEQAEKIKILSVIKSRKWKMPTLRTGLFVVGAIAIVLCIVLSFTTCLFGHDWQDVGDTDLRICAKCGKSPSVEKTARAMSASATYGKLLEQVDYFNMFVRDYSDFINEVNGSSLSISEISDYEDMWEKYYSNIDSHITEIESFLPDNAYSGVWKTMLSSLYALKNCCGTLSNWDTNGDGSFESGEISFMLSNSLDTESILQFTEEFSRCVSPESDNGPASQQANDDSADDGQILDFQEDLDDIGNTIREENDTGNYSIDEDAVWQYCMDRWDYYDNLEGGYSGDMYTDQVFADAGNRFGISASQAEYIWDKVDKEKLGLG